MEQAFIGADFTQVYQNKTFPSSFITPCARDFKKLSELDLLLTIFWAFPMKIIERGLNKQITNTLYCSFLGIRILCAGYSYHWLCYDLFWCG